MCLYDKLLLTGLVTIAVSIFVVFSLSVFVLIDYLYFKKINKD